MSRDQSQTTRTPVVDEVWRNGNGAIRHVRLVDDDGYSVTFSRPSSGRDAWDTVLMHQWLIWVDGATLIKKPVGAPSKEWKYATDV